MDDDARIPEATRRHILDGDRSGGGHRFTSLEPNKSLFPESWDDDLIIAAIIRTLDGPYTTSDDHEHLRDPNIRNLYGYVDGVRVVVGTARDGSVITAHPIDGVGVMRTGKEDPTRRKNVPLGAVRHVPLPHGLGHPG
ncbi:EndoU domain-containing protein [Mycolicibacter longobardus]|uniref:Bacterial EndoU nuclease domain-containing protein n=1 Tax=Mycolicibacter longobardus TaxID=1108812 RepID=A0A1X1YRW5_9MYCO|nr:EndoU domain-containing protein [Mycolicibacter longobardus]MCV7383493.1 EndoU domain-containing protein [Mycolicibacter longobardus]ORW13731.1 hypothetical protein AWC16_02875 [Mycolicibacter longobardus]